MDTTSVTAGFRVEDCTFQGIRFQDEIKNEIKDTGISEGNEVQPPASLTPGQLIKFYEECCNSGNYSTETIAVYQQTITYLRRYEQYSKAAASKLLDEYGESLKEQVKTGK